MSEDSTGEKTFAPTQKRKDDAAKKGDVLRSKELGTAVGVFAGALWLRFAGPWLMSSLEEVARGGLRFRADQIEHFDAAQVLTDTLVVIIVPIISLGVIVMVMTVLSQLLFGDGRFVAANMAPKGSRLNPIKGLGRIFGPNGMIELGKSLLKIVLLGGLAYYWGRDRFDAIIGLGRGELSGQLAAAWELVTGMLMILAVGLALIAAIDFPIQWVRRTNRLKMSHQDMRDENKTQEGSPEKRAAIRNKQRQLAMGGVAKAMNDAQFVLTNPTHFSVAMAYDPALADAPIVLAKGRGDKALAIRELAGERGLPTLEYPALARSVYFTTRENQVIRAELYAAIASILAFVMSLKRGEQPKRPAIVLPPGMSFSVDGVPQNIATS